MEYSDKFIGFVDILGFKSLVEKSEQPGGRSLPEILALTATLGNKKQLEFYSRHGPEICPCSAKVRKDMDIQITQISDCMIISSEISPAGLMNLVNTCWRSAFGLLREGIMVRGYVTRGMVYHTPDQVIGPGYQAAYLNESGVSAFKQNAEERGTPYIEVDQTICQYVANETDECVRKMFDRLVKNDGKMTAIFPFQRLSHSYFIGGPNFDPEREKTSVRTMKAIVSELIDKVRAHIDRDNPSAVSKSQHYLAALEHQLKIADREIEFIDELSQPLSRAIRND